MVKLSFIVPFYNVEPYIEECIRSLYNQDIPWDEYEVICIDDCSSDGSRTIVEWLQQEYPSLKLLRTPKNLRVGGARNMGLDIAQGKYIWFVDSDDYIAPNCLGVFLKELDEHKLDLLQFGNATFYNSVIQEDKNEFMDEKIMTGTEFVLNQPSGKWSNYCLVAWNRIVRRSFWNKHHLRFVEHMMYEDTELSLYMYPLANRMKHLNKVGYYYRINPQSITHTQNSGLTLWYRVLQLYRCLPAYNNAPNDEYAQLIKIYLRSELGQLRGKIKELNCHERFDYQQRILREHIGMLYHFCNWRTWLAIKYGVCCFVPKYREVDESTKCRTY